MQPEFSCPVGQLSFVCCVLPDVSSLAMPTAVQYALAALFGLVFGSFLNVCIARLPHHESIVRPRSHCPQCLKLIPWYDNIPVLSYLVLGAKCRFCRQRISPIYPIVEAFTACVFVLAVAETSSLSWLVKEIVFAMLMIVLIFTDFKDRIIPHSVTLLGIALGLGFSLFVPVNDSLLEWIFRGSEFRLHTTVSSLIGALAGGAFGGGLLYAVGWALKRVSNPAKEYLGFGDVMLMLVVGVFWGIPLSYLTILLGSLAGTLVAVSFIALNKSSREYQWPYGSFLGAAAIYCSLGGPALLAAYKHWAGLRG
jgi:leader peptidase (prepilin peptidase) / N-methyltransferase